MQDSQWWEQHQPNHATYPDYPASGGPGKGGAGIIVLTVLGVVAVLALAGVAAFFLLGSNGGGVSAGDRLARTVVLTPTAASEPRNEWQAASTTTTRTTQPTRNNRVRPSGVYQVCDSGNDQAYMTAAAGNSTTSCPFVVEVRNAYLRGGHAGESATIRAYSPTTELNYRLTCDGGQYVRCTGGRNAVIYLY
ncbi:MAG: hypothetical protein Q4G67_12815 [Actinomycetia bacterium]|nr:hypothetical protein [Actinomycetes bacterium]